MAHDAEWLYLSNAEIKSDLKKKRVTCIFDAKPSL